MLFQNQEQQKVAQDFAMPGFSLVFVPQDYMEVKSAVAKVQIKSENRTSCSVIFFYCGVIWLPALFGNRRCSWAGCRTYIACRRRRFRNFTDKQSRVPA